MRKESNTNLNIKVGYKIKLMGHILKNSFSFKRMEIEFPHVLIHLIRLNKHQIIFTIFIFESRKSHTNQFPHVLYALNKNKHKQVRILLKYNNKIQSIKSLETKIHCPLHPI